LKARGSPTWPWIALSSGGGSTRVRKNSGGARRDDDGADGVTR
jgi:hypothetical protein